MTLLGLAGRTELRRLHQTVQRNISRRHQQTRHESSRQSAPSGNASTFGNELPKGRTIPGMGWAWIEPLATPFRAYGSMQKRSPLLTQFESSLVIYYLGDLSAQSMSSSFFADASYEPVRGLRALLIASFISIPGYKYFLWLGNHFNYRSHLLSIATKVVVNQTFFTPLFNTYFFGMQSLLSGSTFQEAKRRVIDTVPVSWKNSWKLWPAVTAFSFTFIPPQHRNIFAGCIAIFWQTYLSWLNKNAEKAEKGEGRVDEQQEMQQVAGKRGKAVESATV